MRLANLKTRSLQRCTNSAMPNASMSQFGLEAKLFLHLDLDPQALAVEAVLVALLIALHGLEALVQVFVGAPPGVMHAHRVVGGDGTIQKRELLIAVVIAMQILLQYALLVPPLLDGLFQGGIVHPVCCCHRFEYTGFH